MGIGKDEPDMLGDVEELSLDDINDFGGAGIVMTSVVANVTTETTANASAVLVVGPNVVAVSVAMPASVATDGNTK